MENGVNLVGYARAEMGIGESCRNAANAMTAASVPFGIMNYPECTQRQNDRTWSQKEIESPVFNTNVIHVNAEMLQFAILYFLKHRLTENRYTIGYWHWELPEFPDENNYAFNFLQELWVPSLFTLRACAEHSTVPVLKIPHSIEVKMNQKLNRKYFNLPEDQFLFLMMYDTQSTQERKNPKGVIHAFLKAFKHNKKAGLVVKVNMGNAALKEIEYLKELIAEHDNIYVIDQIFHRDEINNLIDVTDSYVSLHRSEGFGLPLAEAMYLGKPVIGTNWSGNTDFMKSNNSCLVNYQLIKVEQDYGLYKAGNVWADPDIEHAAYYMKKIVDEDQWSKALAAKGEEYIKEKHSPLFIGDMIKKRLQNLKRM